MEVDSTETPATERLPSESAVEAPGTFCSRVVIPGDLIDEIPEEKNVILGPGLTREGGVRVVAVKCGLLRAKNLQGNSPVFWVDTHQRRYVACKGENVLGIVTAKAGDIFRVDIGNKSE